MTPRGTLADRWQTAVSEVGDRPFLVHETDEGAVAELSYAEADEMVARVRAGLADHGLSAGSAVQLVHTNSVAFVMTWLACATSGAWMVPSDPKATIRELSEHVRRTSPVVAVCMPSRVDDYMRASEDAGREVEVISVSEDDAALDGLAATVGQPPARPQPSSRLAIMFTSGTTAAPKGVELTQANYAFAGDVMAAASALTRFDRQLVVLPMFHANAQYYSFSAAISAGASVALMSSFSATRFVEQARRHAVTHVSLFAAPIRMILARTPTGTRPLQLRNAWFAQNLSTDQYDAISELLGCRPRQLYGMTETIPAVLVNPAMGGRPTSIGVPTLGCHVRVVDEHGIAVTGAPGSVQIGGHPGTTIFRSYLDDPATTEAAIVSHEDDGFVWFDTGDRAVVDDGGFHYFVGRRSDVLKVAGENVSVVEVEQALAEHPGVHDVAVVGMPDEIRDEVPHAYVVPDATATGHPLAPEQLADLEADLRRWSELHLAPAKQPREYRFVKELPRTSVGKIRKFLLGPKPASGSIPAASAMPTPAIEETEQ